MFVCQSCYLDVLAALITWDDFHHEFPVYIDRLLPYYAFRLLIGLYASTTGLILRAVPVSMQGVTVTKAEAPMYKFLEQWLVTISNDQSRQTPIQRYIHISSAPEVVGS